MNKETIVLLKIESLKDKADLYAHETGYTYLFNALKETLDALKNSVKEGDLSAIVGISDKLAMYSIHNIEPEKALYSKELCKLAAQCKQYFLK